MKETITNINISQIEIAINDRKEFNQNDLSSLADSIQINGLIQPIIVRAISDHKFELIAGERRLRATKLNGCESIPAIIRDMSDTQASAVMLVENTGRVNLNPIEEANAYNKRINELGWTVKQCADSAGVSTIHVRFRIKLLSLREDLQHLIKSDNLKIGYAQILATANLDRNRQLIAIRKLQAHDTPTPVWFRSIVSQLAEQQRQESLFPTDCFIIEKPLTTEVNTIKPALPGTDNPPVTIGQSIVDTIKSHIEFWKQAAMQWNELGKVFKKKQCLAAVDSLESALNSIGA
jgi:ParB/RepB/Spo0J family partition protein